ncbi:ANTAR domain-containing protein [Streptomyces sp. NPDC048254]|uniref:ANTAR domain-containing protein n=1 Tax=Streptomyces sp. NPDC048254 TaxID=3365525 RepID=UPI0037115739
MASRREQRSASPSIHAFDEKITRLGEENAQLRQAVASHAVVDQAIGVLIAVHQLPPAAGWAVLREISQRRNIKLHAVAEAVVDWALGQPIPQEVTRELAPAVQRWKQGSSPPDESVQAARPG